MERLTEESGNKFSSLLMCLLKIIGSYVLLWVVEVYVYILDLLVVQMP
jgi:hypothetical protein